MCQKGVQMIVCTFASVMKRFVVVMLALLYFAVSSGFTMHAHYCMGELVSTSFLPESGGEHNCSHCGMVKKKSGNGCCNDEQKIVKSTDEVALVKSIPLPTTVAFTLPLLPAYFDGKGNYDPESTVSFFSVHDPPEPPSCPIYLEIRSLLI